MIEEVLTIIPAKGRSTRLKGKNMAMLAGKPLVVHAIEQAKAAGVCGEICVGTDDETIAAVARAAGAQVPFLRVGDADDVTQVGEAAANIVHRYQKELNRTFRYMCLLLTTSPLRQPDDIKGCYALLRSNESLDAAMSIVYADKHPCWAWKFQDDHRIVPMFPESCHLDRPEMPKPYYVDGSVYWAKADFFLKVRGNQFCGMVGGYVVPQERAVDIDTDVDLGFCQYMVSRQAAGG